MMRLFLYAMAVRAFSSDRCTISPFQPFIFATELDFITMAPNSFEVADLVDTLCRSY